MGQHGLCLHMRLAWGHFVKYKYRCSNFDAIFLCAGIRVPDSAFIRAVCREHGGAVALTSANISGATSPTSTHDFEELWPQCAAVFDGGVVGADRAGSTVVDLSVANEFRILREGSHPVQTRQLLTQLYNLDECM